MNNSTKKKTYKTILIILSLLLLILPAITTFNEILTSIVMRIELYRLIQNFIVPFQAKMITVVLRIFQISAFPTSTGINIGSTTTLGNHITISWNCIGWQSFILLIITLITGLQGPYKLSSRLQTILIGTLGTFLMNIIRISLVVIFAHFLGKTAGIIFHDYFSTIITIAWLFLFWWFTFNFVLVHQGSQS